MVVVVLSLFFLLSFNFATIFLYDCLFDSILWTFDCWVVLFCCVFFFSLFVVVFPFVWLRVGMDRVFPTTKNIIFYVYTLYFSIMCRIKCTNSIKLSLFFFFHIFERKFIMICGLVWLIFVYNFKNHVKEMSMNNKIRELCSFGAVVVVFFFCSDFIRIFLLLFFPLLDFVSCHSSIDTNGKRTHRQRKSFLCKSSTHNHNKNDGEREESRAEKKCG